MGPGDTRAMSIEVLRSCHAALIMDLFKAGRLNHSVAEKIDFRVVVRIKGRHGGTDILSDPFEFPIRVCYGCLQTGFAGPFAAFNFPERVPACDKLDDQPLPGQPLPRAHRPGHRPGAVLRAQRRPDEPAVPRRPRGHHPHSLGKRPLRL